MYIKRTYAILTVSIQLNGMGFGWVFFFYCISCVWHTRIVSAITGFIWFNFIEYFNQTVVPISNIYSAGNKSHEILSGRSFLFLIFINLNIATRYFIWKLTSNIMSPTVILSYMNFCSWEIWWHYSNERKKSMWNFISTVYRGIATNTWSIKG